MAPARVRTHILVTTTHTPHTRTRTHTHSGLQFRRLDKVTVTRPPTEHVHHQYHTWKHQHRSPPPSLPPVTPRAEDGKTTRGLASRCWFNLSCWILASRCLKLMVHGALTATAVAVPPRSSAGSPSRPAAAQVCQKNESVLGCSASPSSRVQKTRATFSAPTL